MVCWDNHLNFLGPETTGWALWCPPPSTVQISGVLRRSVFHTLEPLTGNSGLGDQFCFHSLQSPEAQEPEPLLTAPTL